MKKVEKKDNQIVFIANIEDTLANAVRRYMLHVPVMAIESVEISRNDSPLYDETIAHRLGLVPLETDKSTNEKSESKLKLEVSREGKVYSEDLKGKPTVAFKKIPITTLAKGQELHLTGFVRAGKGIEHAKFSPGIMFYRKVSEIELDKDLYEQVRAFCPENQIKEKGNKIIVVDNGKKELADACEGLAKKAKKSVEKQDTEETVITVESFGQMPPEEVFRKSVDVLKKDLNAFQKAIGKVA